MFSFFKGGDGWLLTSLHSRVRSIGLGIRRIMERRRGNDISLEDGGKKYGWGLKLHNSCGVLPLAFGGGGSLDCKWKHFVQWSCGETFIDVFNPGESPCFCIGDTLNVVHFSHLEF